MGGNIMMAFARFRILVLGLALMAGGVLLSLPADAQVYNRFGPANGILKGNPSTYVTTAAAAADITSLWTGTCDSTTYMRGDGQCIAVPAGVVGANPTATIGATAVNGVATTFMRSDAAPALPATLPALSGANLTSLNAGNISSGTLAVARGGIGVGTLTGIAKGNGTSAFTAAASSDVRGLWTGTCDATTFLRGDGSCQVAGGGTSGANPTATIGLTAVNGVSTNFLRSDGAPALSQAIVPTWTGVHTFNAAPVIATSLNPDADIGADLGTASLRFTNVFATNLCGAACATNALVDNSGTVARFGNGSAWTEVNLPKFTSVLGGINITRSGSAVAVLDNTAASTGTSLGFYNNGVERGQISAINGANAICVGGAVGDICIRAESGNVRMSTNGGAASQIIPRSAYARMTASNGSTCTVASGSGFASCVRNSTGDYTITMTTSHFTASPACTVTSRDSSNGFMFQVGGGNTTTHVEAYNAAAAAVDTDFDIICMGS